VYGKPNKHVFTITDIDYRQRLMSAVKFADIMGGGEGDMSPPIIALLN